MRLDYEWWLASQKYAAKSSRIAEARRVEEHYGSLDWHQKEGTIEAIIADLSYSAEDARRGKPIQSRLPICGDLATNLRSYRSAVRLYCRFLLEASPS